MTTKILILIQLMTRHHGLSYNKLLVRVANIYAGECCRRAIP